MLWEYQDILLNQSLDAKITHSRGYEPNLRYLCIFWHEPNQATEITDVVFWDNNTSKQTDSKFGFRGHFKIGIIHYEYGIS